MIPEVNSIQPIHLEFNNMIETKSIEELLVGEILDNIYQFTGFTEYDPEIVEIIFNQSRTELTIKGKTEGTTDITVQITDENELIEPVTATFTVYVANILPDEIEIPGEFIDILTVTYEHGTEGEEDDRLYVSVSDDLNGYLNGWLIDGISLWPLSSDQIHDGPSMLIEDPRARLAVMVSCSQDSFMYQIPRDICLDISSIASLEGDALSIAPIIDPIDEDGSRN